MPAWSNYEKNKGFAATAALTKFRAVKLSTSAVQTVSPIAAAADIPIGITQESLSTAEQAKNFGVPVALISAGGISEMEAGAAVNIGDAIVLDSAGRGVPVGTASAGTQVIGRALSAVTGTGLRFTLDMGAF